MAFMLLLSGGGSAALAAAVQPKKSAFMVAQEDDTDGDMVDIVNVMIMRKEAQMYSNLASEPNATTLKRSLAALEDSHAARPIFTASQVANFTWAGLSLLHFAAVHDNVEYAEVLCRCGAELDAVVEDTDQARSGGIVGMTAFHIAALFNHIRGGFARLVCVVPLFVGRCFDLFVVRCVFCCFSATHSGLRSTDGRVNSSLSVAIVCCVGGTVAKRHRVHRLAHCGAVRQRGVQHVPC